MSERQGGGTPLSRGESLPVTFHHGQGPEVLERVLPLRRLVFVQEQGGPPEDEPDEHDAAAVHLMLMRADQVLAAARLLRTGPGQVRLGRVCVCQQLRGLGLGRRLVVDAERLAASLGAELVRLSAQEEAVGFYERLGYSCQGDPFMDAGIPHRWMVRSLGTGMRAWEPG